MPGQATKKQTGSTAEELAQEFLRENGFSIVDKNIWVGKYGEIDLIAKKAGKIHFIEVKSLVKNIGFKPELNFTPAKKKKVANLANYLANKYGYGDFQIDLIAVELGEGEKPLIRFYQNVSL